jgi:3-oxoacyl-ACP reductase-like protein
MTMGFFSTILDKLGLSKAEAATPAATAPAPTAAPAPASAAAPASAPAAPVVNPIAMVDVVALMEAKAKANPQKLNWRTSIVDLLKLLDMDSSLQARK